MWKLLLFKQKNKWCLKSKLIFDFKSKLSFKIEIITTIKFLTFLLLKNRIENINKNVLLLYFSKTQISFTFFFSRSTTQVFRLISYSMGVAFYISCNIVHEKNKEMIRHCFCLWNLFMLLYFLALQLATFWKTNTL